MHPQLTPPHHPVAILPKYIASAPTTLHIKQHGKILSLGTFTVASCPHDPTSGDLETKLFSVDGNCASPSFRRHFYDVNGTPLFDLHMKRMGITWFVDLPEAGGSGKLNGRSGSGSGSEFESGPGSKSEKRIATVAPRWDALKDKFDVLFRNAAPDSVGEDIKLEVRGQDIWKLRINVYLDGKVVMTAKRTEKLSVYLPGIPPQWSVDVAEGMDLSVASLIVVVMAAQMYYSSLPSTHTKPS